MHLDAIMRSAATTRSVGGRVLRKEKRLSFFTKYPLNSCSSNKASLLLNVLSLLYFARSAVRDLYNEVTGITKDLGRPERIVINVFLCQHCVSVSVKHQQRTRATALNRP